MRPVGYHMLISPLAGATFGGIIGAFSATGIMAPAVVFCAAISPLVYMIGYVAIESGYMVKPALAGLLIGGFAGACLGGVSGCAAAAFGSALAMCLVCVFVDLFSGGQLTRVQRRKRYIEGGLSPSSRQPKYVDWHRDVKKG